MSILDRKPAKYSTSDLFWEPSAAPTDGAIGDINTMKLDPSHLAMAQDVIIDTNGVLRNRGGFVTATSDTFASITPSALVLTAAGALLIGRDSTGATLAQGTSTQALTGFATVTAAQVVNGGTAQNVIQQPSMPTITKLGDNKGAIIAFDYGFLAFTLNNTSIWGGNVVTTSDTVTGTAASTIGTKAIAGVGTAWTTALEGCYLFIGATAATAIYVGQVDQVTSTTALLLKKGALKTIAAAAPAFKTIRPVQYMVYKGRITTTTTSTSVIGANTKFNSSGPAGSASVFLTNSVSNVFRYSDGAFIGQVSSVQNDTTLTLSANAAIAMTNEEYYITNPQFAQTSGNGPTFMFYAGSCARYADRYWYGCFSAADPSIKATNGAIDLICLQPNSIAFSKKNDPECLDLDPTSGDFLSLPVTHNHDRIRAICATRGGLVVFRTRDTFLVTGYSPETFRAIKIADDGISLSLAFKEYNEGVIWAGAKSIWYFNGTQIVDLINNKTKRFYQRLLRPFDVNSPLTMAISNDHVLVSYPPLVTGANRTWPSKNTTGTIGTVCLVVNLLNGAVSFFTNIVATSSTYSDTLGTSVILARGNNGLSNATGYLIKGSTVFVDSSVAADNFDALSMVTTVSGATIGPSVMFETVKLSLGNAARLKFWKMLLMNYSSDVSMTATFISTNDTTLDFPNISTGTAGVVTLPVSANVGILKRIKFLVRAPQLSIRVYQTSAVSATSQRFKLYWYTVGGKWMRQGRQQ